MEQAGASHGAGERWLRRRRLALSLVALLLIGCTAGAAPSHAQDEDTLGSQPVPVTVPSVLPGTPGDFRVSAEAAINIANRTDTAIEVRKENKNVEAIPQVKSGIWEVFYNSNGEGKALVIVNGVTGEVTDSWTGDQVAWQMARGYEGAFGHILNAPYVWIPLCLIFFLGLFDFSRARRIAHLDLLVLLSFSISHIFFNLGEIGASVPLAYPPLIYLFGRMIWIGWRGGGEGLRPSVPIGALALAVVFLIAFRVAINIADSAVIDVGYAGVIGADRIADFDPLYGENAFPEDNRPGDTYGPANYLAYVPFELALPWSGTWDSLPSARTAALFFDLAAIIGLFALGRRLRQGKNGRDLGVILGFGWAAFPYTTFATQSSSNDALLAALLIWALVAFHSVGARGALLAIASLTKFAPLALVPLFAAGERGLLGPWKDRALRAPAGTRLAYFATVFIALSALLLAYPAIDPGLSVAYDRTLATQLDRVSPFSIWGQVTALEPLKIALMVALTGFAVALAFVPERRSLLQICALTAAVLVGSQIILEHWFYLYIPWFLGPLLVAIATPPARRYVPTARVRGRAGRARRAKRTN